MKLDNKKRATIVPSKREKDLAVTDSGDGSIGLTPVKRETKEPFPPGSLVKYVEEFNREWAGVKLKVPTPPKDWE